MAWFRREKYTSVAPPRKRLAIPEGFWVKCKGCDAIIAKKDFDAAHNICPTCDHHHPIPAIQRIEMMCDPGTFVETDADMISGDPLEFSDKKPYKDRLVAYRAKTGLKDAVRTGSAKLNGRDVSLAVMDFGFIGGSMGSVVGEKVTRAIELGLEKKIPVIIVSQSGGARMQEGTVSLMQLPKTCAALSRLGKAGIPYVSILTNPTTAGAMASFSSLGDVIISEPDALIGFAGPRVIEQTINQILPKGFQRAEFVRDHGFIDIVCHRNEIRQKLINILDVLMPSSKRAPARRAPSRAASTTNATKRAASPSKAAAKPRATKTAASSAKSNGAKKAPVKTTSRVKKAVSSK